MRTLHTIGYEQASLADFVATLRGAEIKCVLDVRAVPVSRKRGFSKSSLQAALAASGIEYMHIGSLGNPTHGRQAAKSGHVEEFRQIFDAHLKSNEARDGLAAAASRASEGGACLLCLEREAHHCHRLLVAEALALEHKFVVKHLTVSSSAASSANGGWNGESAHTRESGAAAEPTAW